MAQRFSEKIAFITGGATGLGRGFAEALHAEGAAVALADIDLVAAEATAAALHTSDAPAVAVACDVADEHSVGRAVAQVVEQLGGIDVLVNNAARHLKKYSRSFSSLTHEEVRGLLDVNILGVVNCSLACRQAMIQRGGGVIVNMSSAAGYAPSGPYGVTKLAVRGLTVALATELAPDGIRVVAIAPTLTPTESVLAEFTDDEFERSITTRQLVRRRATLDDIANTLLFLCSDDAGFITGETVRVTGGAALSV